MPPKRLVLVPHLQVFFDAGLPEGRRCDAGVGAHNVQAPELLDPGVERGRDGMEVPHVGHRCEDLSAGGLDQRDRLVEFVAGGHRIAVGRNVGADVHPDDVRPFGREADRMTAALPAGDPGDERDLVVQRTHLPLASLYSNRVTHRTVT